MKFSYMDKHKIIFSYMRATNVFLSRSIYLDYAYLFQSRVYSIMSIASKFYHEKHVDVTSFVWIIKETGLFILSRQILEVIRRTSHA